MLKLIVCSIFMTPLIINGWILSNMMMLSLLIFIMFFSKNLMSMGYMMQIDSVSYGLIMLTIWISFLMIISSPTYKNNKNMFLLMILWLMIFLMMSFCSSNLLIFYIFFETSLIPIIVIIMGWGYQPERIMASYYLLFYTLSASLPMLMSIIFLMKMNMSGMFILMSMTMGNFLVYLSMILAFLIKMPLFLFHLWLPKAHVEAPVSGSMILAGVLLKLGGYGLMRVMMIIPSSFLNYSYIWISISVFGSVMISILCMVQVDMKSLIAYSSVAHMGLVVGGIMTMNLWGFMGSYYMMIGHGLCSSGLFCLANISYERTGSRSIMINKGMLTFMPSMTMMWFLMCSGNMSCPPTINLAGEIMIINSLISWNSMILILLMLSSFLSACYSLYLFSYTQHGMMFSSCYSFNSGNVREYFLIMMHWIPLNLIILKLNMLM
uniref:NADH-ubiquinone oxidoreductase chain 4 n=1 Tax=Diceroprocta semicincta TaxID=946270 RepID=A0A088DP62_9HEMI|nr:NADH dehydrogenase subunit 4 [Diceroprocta semicincta]